MEARLETRRNPVIALVFALAVALLLGAIIGYLVKPVSTVAGPAGFTVVTTTQAAASANTCDFVGGHKGC
jgi:ABC-type transporter Mla subunit MlaD